MCLSVWKQWGCGLDRRIEAISASPTVMIQLFPSLPPSISTWDFKLFGSNKQALLISHVLTLVIYKSVQHSKLALPAVVLLEDPGQLLAFMSMVFVARNWEQTKPLLSYSCHLHIIVSIMAPVTFIQHCRAWTGDKLCLIFTQGNRHVGNVWTSQ